MYYKYYLMTDFNDRYRTGDWMIMTECPKDRIEELASLSQKLCSEGYTDYEEMDFSDCWGDMDYLVRLIEYDGYECRVIDFDTIEW